MSFIEQMLFGHNHLSEATGRGELARSAGMGAEAANEICGLCEAWGQPPELGLPHPVLLSHPLQSSMPSMRGKLYAVICVVPAEVPLFHALVISDATYSAYRRNPYAIANAVTFCSEWLGGPSLDRLEIDNASQAPLVHPAANAADIGLVDEAVMQFIMTGELHLSLELPVRASDRALALIIASLPIKERKKLNFASFTTTNVSKYELAGKEAEGTAFAGWQRLMMAHLDTGATEKQHEYKKLVAEFLEKGDLGGLERLSNRFEFTATVTAPTVFAPGKGLANSSARETATPLQAPSPEAGPSGSIPATNPFVRKSMIQRGPGLRPMTAASGRVRSGTGSMPVHGLDPASKTSRPTSPSRNKVRSRLTSPVRRGRRGGGSHFFRTFSVLLVLGLAAWVGTMWFEGKTLSESLAWAGIPGMDGGRSDNSHTGTLLEVVDVGQVYRKALRHTGGKGFGLTASSDVGRDKALGRLRSGATTPLLQQVALFTSLGSEGIQQGGRADREVERLVALAQQGLVIKQEMDRLELAWYSLTTSTNWRDLPKLSDAAISARWDSLAAVEKGVLADVRLGMGTTVIRKELRESRRHVNGMAEVVRLFQAPHWSADWEKQMGRAAANVVPTASRITRAYRNSAYAFIRLKRAEREQTNRSLPYAGRFDVNEWPTAEAKELLIGLRKESGRFSHQNAPQLLGATLALYTALEAPQLTIEKITVSAQAWKSLEQNPAVKFDPDLYLDFLERMKFEAAQQALAKNSADASVPSHLYSPSAALAAAAFADSLTSLTTLEQWQAMNESATDPFLGRWSAHLAADMQSRLAYLQHEFDKVWAECRGQTASLQSQVKAGEDWSENWRVLYETARTARSQFEPRLSQDLNSVARFTYLDSLIVGLEQERPLGISRVTVRLAQKVLAEPSEMQLELRTPVRGGVWTSKPFLVGPSAPDGTGWVGTAFLDWSVPVSPLNEVAGRVVLAESQNEVLMVNYRSLADGEGPASMGRAQSVPEGSLSFRIDLEDYWRGLNIMALGLVF